MDIIALAREDGMRSDLDLGTRIARLPTTDTGSSLATQAKGLAIACAGGNADVEHRAVGKRELLLAAIDRVEKIERQAIVNGLSAHADIAAPLPAENLRKDIVRS